MWVKKLFLFLFTFRFDTGTDISVSTSFTLNVWGTTGVVPSYDLFLLPVDVKY